MNNIYANKDLSVLMIGISEWQGKYASIPNAYAKELSKYTNVYYVDRPYTLKDFITNFKTSKARRIALSYFSNRYRIMQPLSEFQALFLITPVLIIPINFLPAGKIYDLFQKFNEWLIHRRIIGVFKRKRIKKFVFLNSYFPFAGINFPATFKPALTIYHCWDDIRHSEYIYKHGPSLEISLIKKSDFILTSSYRLKELCLRHHSSVYLSHNAADTKLFRKESLLSSKQVEIFNPDKKFKGIIGYTGNIDDRVNFKIMLNIAEDLSEYLLVLVGPINSKDPVLDRLKKFDNVKFTGSVAYDYLPYYLHQFDSAIIPFKYNELTRSIYPLKVNEYLAAGKPVVSSRFSKDIESFGDIIYVADQPEDFNSAILRSIKEDNTDLEDRRILFSENNTWSKRIDQFNSLVEKYLTPGLQHNSH